MHAKTTPYICNMHIHRNERKLYEPPSTTTYYQCYHCIARSSGQSFCRSSTQFLLYFINYMKEEAMGLCALHVTFRACAVCAWITLCTVSTLFSLHSDTSTLSYCPLCHHPPMTTCLSLCSI